MFWEKIDQTASRIVVVIYFTEGPVNFCGLIYDHIYISISVQIRKVLFSCFPLFDALHEDVSAQTIFFGWNQSRGPAYS